MTLKGKKVSLEELKGKVVLLEFWATWHRERGDDLKHLKRVHDRLKDQGLVLIGVNLNGNKETARGFVREHQIAWPQVFVEKSVQDELPQAYGVRRAPSIFLIDGEGKIRGTSLQAPSVESAAARLLAAQKGEEVQK